MNSGGIQYAHAADGVRIAFWVVGRGPPLILTIDSYSDADTALRLNPEFRSFLDRLAASHSVILYDPRGTGASDRSVTSFTMQEMASDLSAIVEHLNLSSTAIFGNYHLGTASIVYAAEHPEKVSQLVLWHAYRTLEDVAGNSLFGATRSLVSQDWQLFTEMLASVVMGWETGEAARRFAGQIRDALDRETLLAIMKATTSYDVRAYLPKLSMPTLVMHRRDCRRHPVEIARKLAAEINGARLVLVDGNAMLYYLGEQSRVLDPLLAFLNQDGDSRDEPRGETSEPAHMPRLSTRESEVAVLVALGCTNRDIAERLVISEHTANLHVKHILAKLGFRSRAQIAAWVAAKETAAE